MNSDRIVEAMLTYRSTFMNKYSYRRTGPDAILSDDVVARLEARGSSPEQLRAAFSGTHGDSAFLLGVVFDGMVTAEKAWTAPVFLRNYLGTLSPMRLASIASSSMSAAIKAANCGALYPRQMGRFIVESFRHVRDHYGRPRGIWETAISAGEVIARFERLSGVSQKKARMAAKLLALGWGAGEPIAFAHFHELDIPVDIHVAKVFVRSGLVRYGVNEQPSSSKLVRDVTIVARALVPDFPALLDDSAFAIGRNWCLASNPNCVECPLRHVRCCRPNGSREHWRSISANATS